LVYKRIIDLDLFGFFFLIAILKY